MEHYRKNGTDDVVILSIDAQNNYSVSRPGEEPDGYTSHRWEHPERWDQISEAAAELLLGYSF